MPDTFSWKSVSGVGLALLGLSCAASCASPGGNREPRTAYLRTDSTEIAVTSHPNVHSYSGAIGFVLINNGDKPVSRSGCSSPTGPDLEKKVNGRWVPAIYPINALCRRVPDFSWESGPTYPRALGFNVFERGHGLPELLVDSINGVYRLHWILTEGRKADATGARKIEAVSNEFRMKLRPATDAEVSH